MDHPLFTIATITYNSGKWVRQTIESVLASSFSDFEFLISDDSSTDDTWDIICEYKDARIKAWRNDSNIREYPNRNKVLKQARGKFILFVDGDDILYKYSLRNLNEYIHCHPKVVMIWGVPPVYVDFAVLPIVLNTEQTLRILYESERPFAIIGFSETLFHVETLKKIGGLPENYAVGDTYIRKRMVLEGNILLIPMGLTFWRRSENQASQKASRSFAGFLESYQIDLAIISLCDLNNKAELRKVITGSFIRRLLMHTVFKFNFFLFWKLFRRARLSLSEFKFLFKSSEYSYSPAKRIEEPLMNDFNFKV
jgi:glycosyltransferase involved in cell wall biosynthesis